MDADGLAAAIESAGLSGVWRTREQEVAIALANVAESRAVMALPPHAARARSDVWVGQGEETDPPPRAGDVSDTEGDELHWLDAVALGERFRDGRLTPSALLEHLLERIGRIDPALHAFVALRSAEARAEAAQSDRRLAAGAPLGPLDGIPVAIKDVIDVAGMATTCHSRSRLKALATLDAPAVARLRTGGAVIVGKLSTHEFAIGGPAFDLPFPPALNPWNRAHHPGGSSSGAGAAVAAGLVPLAIGTDTAGSVRNPASTCGVVGLKPGYDLIPREGVVPLAPSLDHVGVLARSAGDCGIALAVMSESPAPATAKAEALAGLRVGYVRHFHVEDLPADPEICASLDAAALRLALAGARVVEVELPRLDQFAIANRLLLQAEGWAEHGAAIGREPGQFSALTRKALLPGAFLTEDDVALARQRRSELNVAVDAVLADNDVLLCASSMNLPCRIDDPAAIAATYMRQARTPFNLTGHPALTVPAGLAVSGLPLSLQLAAGHGAEALLLRVAQAWEAIGGAFLPPPID